MSKNKKIILCALLLALSIVLSRFLSVRTPITKISFSFVAAMLCATWLGPKWSVLLNVLADIIGATLFPSGAFFVGYTISTAIAGFIYGIFLYKKEENSYTTWKFISRTCIAVILVTLICNIGLNTLWTSMTSGSAFLALFWTRLPKQLFMIPVHIIVFLFLERLLRIPFDKYIRSANDTD